MTGERTVWLLRHGPASSRVQGAEKTVQPSSLVYVRRAGILATKPQGEGGLGLKLSVMGISKNKHRTRQTALEMADHLPEKPELIEYAFLDEVELERYDPDLSRPALMNRILQREGLPEFLPIIGEIALKRIYKMDERIECCVTSGTKSVAIQLALQQRGVLLPRPPSYKYLTGVGVTLMPTPTEEDPNAVHVSNAALRNL